MGVVRRCGDGDGARAAHVGVAQLVGEELELVTGEAVVVPQDVVVGGSAGPLGRKGQVKEWQQKRGVAPPARSSPGCQHDCRGKSQTRRGG